MFRNDPLEPQFARFFEKLRAVAFDVIAVTQHAGIAQRLQQLREDALSLAQRAAREIESLDIDQIEDMENQTRTAALIDRLLQQLKTRTPRRSSATISPSRIALFTFRPLTALPTLANFAVQSLRFLVQKRTCRPYVT